MNFVLNGRIVELDAAIVRARVLPSLPDPIRTHWVEIDGRRWPPKQAFRVATGLTDEPFISHFALRVFSAPRIRNKLDSGRDPAEPEAGCPKPNDTAH
jgi:hypothetical protein